jgi:hypothetical protein
MTQDRARGDAHVVADADVCAVLDQRVRVDVAVFADRIELTPLAQ